MVGNPEVMVRVGFIGVTSAQPVTRTATFRKHQMGSPTVLEVMRDSAALSVWRTLVTLLPLSGRLFSGRKSKTHSMLGSRISVTKLA